MEFHQVLYWDPYLFPLSCEEERSKQALIPVYEVEKEMQVVSKQTLSFI